MSIFQRAGAIDLDPAERHITSFEAFHKLCAAGALFMLAWVAFHGLHWVWAYREGKVTGQFLAQIGVVSAVMLAFFPIMLALLQSQNRRLIAFAAVPLLLLVIFFVGPQLRPLAYRLTTWSDPITVRFNLSILAGVAVFAIYMYLLMRGWRSASALLDIGDLPVLRGQHLLLRRHAIDKWFSLPPPVALMTRGATKTRLLYVAHALLFAAALIMPFVISLFLVGVPRMEQQMHYGDVPENFPLDLGQFYAAVQFQTWMLLASPFVCLVLLWISGRLLSVARRGVRLSMAELLEKDMRPPVLFLRSFQDDQVRLRRPRNWARRLLAGIGGGPDMLDHLLIEELSGVGPVVALGAPGETIPPYGAARGYFEMNDWQTAVAGLLDSSALIVLVVDDTPGTWWEVEQIAGNGAWLAKSLFLTHPNHAASGKSEALWRRVADILQRNGVAGDGAESAAASHALLGWYVKGASGPLQRLSRTFSRGAFSLALRDFAASVATPHASSVFAAPDATVETTAPGVVAPAGWAVHLVRGACAAVATALLFSGLHAAGVPYATTITGVNIGVLWMLASALALPALLYAAGVRSLATMAFLISVWVLASFLSSRLYHFILQTEVVTSDMFDHHAEFIAQLLVMFAMATAIGFEFKVRQAARLAAIATGLSLAAAAGRWATTAATVNFISPQAVAGPVFLAVNQVFYVAPAFIFISVALHHAKARG